MAVNPQKLLPPSNLIASTNESIVKNSSPVVLSQKSQKNIAIIRVKVVQIEKILKGTLALQKKELDNKKKADSSRRREKIEEKLETKPKAESGKIKMPSLPRMGFLDWVKNFIGNVILGYFAVRLVDYLPKIIPIVNLLGKATDFVLDLGGKLLDGLVTFIDWGYRAYDATRGFVKNLFGNDGVKQFDQLSGLLNQFLNLAIIAGMATAGSGGFGGGKSGGVRPRPGTGGRPRVTTSGGSAGGIDLRNPLRQRPRVTTGAGGKPQFRLPGTGARVTTSGGKRALLSSVRPFLKRIPLPVVGALIDFGLSVALGESPGRAAFRAIGAGLLGAIGAAAGSVVPVAGNFIGGLLGGFAGDAIGGALYDFFFGGKSSTPKGKTVKKANGGITRGGKTQGGVRRTIKKQRYKRKISRAPEKTQFKTDIASPLRKSGEELDRTKYFGPILALTTKLQLKEEPTAKDYENVGLGLNLLISKGIDDGQLKGGLIPAFSDGGMVDADFLSAVEKGVDIGSWISTIFKKEFETNAQKTLRMIREMKMKEEKIKEKEKKDPNLEVGPGGVVTGGNADFWAMVAVASLENSNPQGQADVAQVLYNRLSSGKYAGKSIKELVIAPGQFQPVREGDPSLWAAISDKQSAIAAVASHPRGRGNAERMVEAAASAIQNPTLQKSAAEFVGGRTDFSATGQYTPYPGAIGIVQRYGHDIGWFVGPGSIAYGKTNPGPARAPQLGDITVMGAGGVLGTGMVSSVDQFTPMARSFGLTLTSSYRPGDPGYHGKNRARDYSNDAVGNGTPQQLAFAKHLAEKYGSSLTQLIYTPLGYGIANKKKVGLDYWGDSTNAQHYHHVHVAYAKGGRVRKPTRALIGEKGPEFIFDADTTAGLDRLAPQLLERLNMAKTKPQLASILQSYTGYEQPYAEPEYIEIPVPMPMMMSGESDYESSEGSGMMFGGDEEGDSFDALYQGG